MPKSMIDSKSGRWICCRERPYNPNNPEHKKHRWAHPESEPIPSLYDDVDRYKCHICGLEFEVTVPE